MTKGTIKQSNTKSIPRWGYVFLGLVIMLCLGTVYSWSVFRLPIESLYGVGATLSGLPYMTSLASYALFMLLTGRRIHQYSPRLITGIGGILVSLGWVLSAYAPNIYVLTITYGVISGAGLGIVYGVPMAVVAKWFPDKKGLAVGLVLVGFGLSPLITAPLARYLVQYHGVMNAFLLLGVSFGIIIPLFSLPIKYPSPSDDVLLKANACTVGIRHDVNTSIMLKSKSFKGLYFNYIIATMIGLMLIGMTGTVGTEHIKLSSGEVPWLMSLFAVFNGVGRPVFGWVTDRFSSKYAMVISYGLIILSAILMLLAREGSTVLFAMAFCIFWFNLGGWLAIAPTSTLALYGTKHYSQNYGVVFTAYGMGAIIGMMTSGILLDMFHRYQFIFYWVIALCCGGIILTLATFTASRGEQGSAHSG